MTGEYTIVVTFTDAQTLTFKKARIDYAGSFALVRDANGEEHAFPSHVITTIKRGRAYE